MMKKKFILLACLSVILNSFGQRFNISKEIVIPGNEGWDYLTVDDITQHLFVSHGSVVNVVDLKTGNLIATIPDTNGVHGIAIANDLNKAFITDGKDNAVTIIDLTTFAVIEKLPVNGLKPDAVLYDAFSHQVFVYNGRSSNATVINARTNNVGKIIPLDGKPEFSATNAKGLVYVNIEDKNEIQVINTATLEVVNTWSISPGDEPSGLALDIETNRLFSVCGNKKMIVTDAVTGKQVASLPIGDGCDGVAFDAKRKRIFSSNGEGTITVVEEKNKDTFTVLETIKTQKGARTITLNKTTGQLYLPTADFGKAPEPTPEVQRPRPTIVNGSFKVLVVDQL